MYRSRGWIFERIRRDKRLDPTVAGEAVSGVAEHGGEGGRADRRSLPGPAAATDVAVGDLDLEQVQEELLVGGLLATGRGGQLDEPLAEGGSRT
ncbi:hypothetical protein J7E88_10420 [Streptomyces sp. ISL-10]|nr:hypothetical protein [Streptomyces sp. ISL-10]